MNDKEHHIKFIFEAIIAEADRVNETLENLQSKTRRLETVGLVKSSLDSLQTVYNKLINEEMEVQKMAGNVTFGNISKEQIIFHLNEISLLSKQIKREILKTVS